MSAQDILQFDEHVLMLHLDLLQKIIVLSQLFKLFINELLVIGKLLLLGFLQPYLSFLVCDFHPL